MAVFPLVLSERVLASDFPNISIATRQKYSCLWIYLGSSVLSIHCPNREIFWYQFRISLYILQARFLGYQTLYPPPLPRLVENINSTWGISPLTSFIFKITPMILCISGIKCPVCSKFIPPDDIECHLVVCLTKPRITYNGKSMYSWSSQQNPELHIIVSVYSWSSQQNPELHIMVSVYSWWSQQNQELHIMVSVYSWWSQQNQELHIIVSVYSCLSQQNQELRIMVSVYSWSSQQNQELRKMVSLYSWWSQQNQELHIMVSVYSWSS